MVSCEFDPREQKIREYQRRMFGPRYEGASLSKLEGNDWVGMKACEFMKKKKNFLVYHGSPGIGKTYFCAALAEWYLFEFNTHRYYNEKDLLSRLRGVISSDGGDYALELQYLTDDQFVIIDDIGSGINPEKCTYKDLEWRREVLFNLLDYRYNNQLPTVFTSNFTENDFLKTYSERIHSRLFAKENIVISVFGNGLDKRQQGM